MTLQTVERLDITAFSEVQEPALSSETPALLGGQAVINFDLKFAPLAADTAGEGGGFNSALPVLEAAERSFNSSI